jgi:hypothetical protein
MPVETGLPVTRQEIMMVPIELACGPSLRKIAGAEGFAHRIVGTVPRRSDVFHPS